MVFDLDGTLVDSLGDIITHLNGALADHGLPTRGAEQIAEWVGYGAEQLVARAVPSANLAAPVLATFRARYRGRPVIETHLYPGLDRVLDALEPRYQLAVLSNKPHDLTREVCAAVLARWPFAVIAGAHPDRAKKPDPQALRAVAAELDVDIAACAMVGDSEVDIQTARAAGATSIAVSWGMRPLAVLTDARPDRIVHTPDELLAALT